MCIFDFNLAICFRELSKRFLCSDIFFTTKSKQCLAQCGVEKCSSLQSPILVGYERIFLVTEIVFLKKKVFYTI